MFYAIIYVCVKEVIGTLKGAKKILKELRNEYSQSQTFIKEDGYTL